MLCTSGFVDEVMFAHNQPGKGDADGAYTQSDSPRAALGAKSDVCDCLVSSCTHTCCEHLRKYEVKLSMDVTEKTK